MSTFKFGNHEYTIKELYSFLENGLTVLGQDGKAITEDQWKLKQMNSYIESLEYNEDTGKYEAESSFEEWCDDGYYKSIENIIGALEA
jgi:hypothetical protein